MNLVPGELVREVFSYVPYNQVHKYLPLIPNPDKGFYLRSLYNTIGFGKDLIGEIWELPDIIPIPTLYDRYVRVLSYFDYVVPGSERFLNDSRCYNAAVDNLDLESAIYFGSLLGWDAKKSKATFNREIGDVRKFLLNPKAQFKNAKIFREIKKGKIPELNDKNIDEALEIAAIFNQYEVIEQIVDKYQVPIPELEDEMLRAAVMTNNLKELKSLFPDKVPEGTKSLGMRGLNLVSPQILKWLVDKGILILMNARCFAFYYLYKPEQFFKSLQDYHYNLYPFYEPLYGYILLKNKPPSEGFIRTLYDWLRIPDENYPFYCREAENVVIQTLSQTDKYKDLAKELESRF